MSFFSRSSFSIIGQALRRLANRLVAARRHAHQGLELRGMSDHELKDLGLGRSEVQAWLRRGVTTRQAWRHGQADAAYLSALL